MKVLLARRLPLAISALLVVALSPWAGSQGQRGANNGAYVPDRASPHTLEVPAPVKGGSSGNLLAGVQPFPDGLGGIGPSGGGGIGTNGYLMNISPFGTMTALQGFFQGARMSGLSKQPGPGLFFSFSGSFGDGGNIYHYPPGGPLVLAGPGAGGFALAGLAYDTTGALWASGDVLSFNDALYTVDIVSGIATAVGVYGGSICGVDAIAEDPTVNVLYGFTGFCYDGSPGDVLILDRATGSATDTGVDLTDTTGALPVCSVVGATFAPDGTGYASIGCGVGQIIEFQTVGATPFLFQVLGNPFIGSALPGRSMTDIEVVF